MDLMTALCAVAICAPWAGLIVYALVLCTSAKRGDEVMHQALKLNPRIIQ